jgi:hypothetical protein
MTCFHCEGKILLEKLSFDQLFSMTEPRRVLRSKTVRGPALDVDATKDGVYYHFNFKSFPSTTGKRHRGYIKFFKPKKQTPLEKIACLVDCDCEDYRYRWAWTNKQRGSSVVGSKSLNQATNRAPKITNPRGKSGLCKHLAALSNFIYGEFETFDGQADASERLDKVVQAVQSRGGKINQDAQQGDAKKAEPPKKPADQKKDSGPAKDAKVPDRSTKVKPQGTVGTKVGSKKLPDEFSDRIHQRFSRVESVLNNVNNLDQILKEADDVQVDPESAEALTLLRDIRDGIRILAAKEEDAPEEPAEFEGDDNAEEGSAPAGPAPEDLPEPGDDFQPGA